VGIKIFLFLEFVRILQRGNVTYIALEHQKRQARTGVMNSNTMLMAK